MQNCISFNTEDKECFINIHKNYSFFNGAVSFLAGICATNSFINANLNQTGRFKETDYIFFEGRKNATNKIYFFFPYDIFKDLLINEWPDSLKLYYKEKAFNDLDDGENALTGFKAVFIYLGQSAYIQFWESIQLKIVNLYGNNRLDWSNVFKFGWIIRNALSHNFKITINDPRIKSVTWRGLEFGFSDQGIDISEKLMFIELIVLMKDIEDELINELMI